MSIVKPLYDHNSQDSAYLVSDYPYGRQLRCQIRYWLEWNKKGVRLVSQTLNPKTGLWNKEKHSTYALLCGAMYIDENNHVQWTCLHQYSDADSFLSFFQSFPDLKLSRDKIIDLKYWIAVKIRMCETTIEGKAIISINKVPQLPSEHDMEKAKVELEIWNKALELVNKLQ